VRKLYEWIRTHKAATVFICISIFALQALVVHALHKWYIGIPWLAATWSSGDMLAYVAGFEAFIGTIFLGLVSLEQNRRAEKTNERLSEENIYLQKIMSQKMMPVVKISSLKTSRTLKSDKIPDPFPCGNSFRRFIRDNTASPVKPVHVIHVNVDVKEGIPIYVRELTFSVCNISEAIIRHICVDDITICGYEGIFSEIRCSNWKPQDGISSLLTIGDSLTVQVMFYFNSEEIKSSWDSELGGLAVSMFLTNTTITGIKFQEFIDIRTSNNGYSHVKYGEGIFDEEEKR